MTEPTDVIRLYLDDDKEPFKTARPPLRFQFSTLHLADGPHRLRIEAHNGLAGESVREVPFQVRNGVAITVSGLEAGQEIAGQVGVIINAYAGNTEVDFEPSRAETPQPIPTWAWLIFLAIIAWTMFYVLNPHPAPAVAGSARVSPDAGERVYLDTCAKCHQETGLGAPGLGPAALKDNDRVLDADPTELVSYVAAGPLPEDSPNGVPARPRMKMLPFGPPKLTNLEFVAVVNHIRSHFGNQAPLITPEAKRFPEDLRAFEQAYRSAIQKKDIEAIWQLYSDDERTRLVRPGAESIDVSTKKAVVDVIRTWLESIKNVNSLSYEDTAYHLFEGGRLLYAHGTVKLEVAPLNGGPSQLFVGQVIRMYALQTCKRMPKPDALVPDESCYCAADGTQITAWRLVFDYATTPMQIGCEPGMGGREGELCPRAEVGRIAFSDVKRILDSLGERAPNAPHGNFWDLPYADFVKFEFPLDAKAPDAGHVRLLNVDVAAGISGSETNLVKGLRDGKDVLVSLPGGGTKRVNIPRMPKNTKPLSPVDLARIISWIDHGMQETLPKDTGPRVGPLAGMETVPVEPGMTSTPTLPEPGMDGGGPATAGTWRDDDVDFAGAMKLLKDLNGKVSGSPHGKFWDLPYAQFVAFEFESNTEPGKNRLVVPGNSAESNLIRGMKGQPLVRIDPTGKPKPFDVGIMPPKGKGKQPDAKALELLERWVDHGCPETRPVAGSTPPAPPSPPAVPAAPSAPPAAPTEPTLPPAVPTAPPPPPPPAPPPTDLPAAPPTPPAAGGLRFDDVIALLKKLGPKASGSPHGKLWELPYDQFVAFEFAPNTESGKVRLLIPGKGAQSNLVRALKGEALIRLTDDGKEVPFPVGAMPSKGKGTPMAADDIAKIEAWIDAGAPK